MPQPISDDLRRRLLEAWAAGEGTLAELGQRFRVSVGFAKKARQHLLRTGEMNRVPQSRHGPRSRVDEAAREQLRAWIRDQPDLTLAELQGLLWRKRGIQVSRSLVAWILPQLGMRRKKNAARAGAGLGSEPKAATGIQRRAARPSRRAVGVLR